MNALEKAPKALEDDLHRRLRRVWDESQSYEEARDALRGLAGELENRCPDLAERLETDGEDTLARFHFPARIESGSVRQTGMSA